MAEVKLPTATRRGKVRIPMVWVTLAAKIIESEGESAAALALARQVLAASEAASV